MPRGGNFVEAALRGGHHRTQPIMHRLGVESTARRVSNFHRK